MFWKSSGHLFRAYKELGVLGQAFYIHCFIGFSNAVLQKKKLRFKMVQGHRVAGGRAEICNHLTPAPLLSRHPLSCTQTAGLCFCITGQQGARPWPEGSFHQGAKARSVGSGGPGSKLWPGVEAALRINSCVIFGKLLHLPDLPFP